MPANPPARKRPDDRYAPLWQVLDPTRRLVYDDDPARLHARPARDSLDPFQLYAAAIALRRHYAANWPGHIWWDDTTTADAPVAIRPEAILLAFLACKTRQQFARFTIKHGPLYLCERHALPIWHDSDLVKRGRRCEGMERPPNAKDGEWTVAFAWLALWRDALATLATIGSRLEAAGTTADTALWDQIKWIPTNLDALLGGGNESRARLGKDPVYDRIAFGAYVTILLTWAHVRPTFAWDGKRLDFTALDVSATNVFGPLVLGLVSGFSGLRKVVTCEYCGDFFMPEQPRIRYCSDCHENKVTQTLAIRRRDEKRREQRRSQPPDV